MKFSNKKVIIWDWNGTLLNDVQLCVSCMNEVLSKRNIPQLNVERYRDIFTFPVKEYYQKAGFNFQEEDFEIPAMEFIAHYYQRIPEAGLFSCVQDVLTSFRDKGLRQLVLSAMEHQQLINSLKSKGILGFFDKVSGLTDHYAHSKVALGQVLLADEIDQKEEMLLIGDTLHDLEVAKELGVDCVLVASGHQSKKRLVKETEWVYDNLLGVAELLA